MLLLGRDGLLQLCLCQYQLLFGLHQGLSHLLHQRLGVLNRMHSIIVFWLRLLNGPEQSRMAVGWRWRIHYLPAMLLKPCPFIL